MQQMSGGSMSGKVRVYEVAKQLNLDPKQVVGLFQAIGVIDVRNHMSSVEPEAVERVKRHLEKQRTHDGVEERVRPGVIKRRAIAKPAPSARSLPDAPSGSSLPVSTTPAAPSHGFDDVMVAPPSQHAPAHENGHSVAEALDSGRLDVVPEERKSARVLERPVESVPSPAPVVEAA